MQTQSKLLRGPAVHVPADTWVRIYSDPQKADLGTGQIEIASASAKRPHFGAL